MTMGWSPYGRRSSEPGSHCSCTRTTAPRWRSSTGIGHALPVAVGFPVETTIAVARLVFGGVLHRYPDLRIIASHGGGTLPYLAGRLDAGWRSDPSLSTRAPSPPSSVLGRLFLDAVLYHPRALRAAADLVGTEHLAFGTDHPFSIADPVANLAAIDEAFMEADADRVLAGTDAGAVRARVSPDPVTQAGWPPLLLPMVG